MQFAKDIVTPQALGFVLSTDFVIWATCGCTCPIETIADDVLVLDHGEVVAAGALAQLGRDAIEVHLVV